MLNCSVSTLCSVDVGVILVCMAHAILLEKMDGCTKLRLLVRLLAVSNSVGDQMGNMTVSQSIKDVLSLPPRCDNTFCTQQLQTLRYRSEIVLKAFGQFGNAHLTLCKQRKEAKSTQIPERAEYARSSSADLLVGRLNDRNSTSVLFAHTSWLFLIV